LFLHSEVIQSRQWNLKDDKLIKKQLDYEFFDTLFAMVIGWAINSAMILLAAATFFTAGKEIFELQDAHHLLDPLLGSSAAIVFAIALLFSGIASTITSGMAAGSIFSGMYREPFDIKDNHSRLGVAISLVLGTAIIFFIPNPFQGLIISQVVLSIQLPITVFLQVYLTSSKKVMGKYQNGKFMQILLYFIAAIVTVLNIMLLISIIV
jgi:manganese transport protein